MCPGSIIYRHVQLSAEVILHDLCPCCFIFFLFLILCYLVPIGVDLLKEIKASNSGLEIMMSEI